MNENAAYSYQGHSFTTPKRVPWLCFCKECGLVRLNNEFSRWAIRLGCNNRDHPDYAAARRRYTNPFE